MLSLTVVSISEMCVQLNSTLATPELLLLAEGDARDTWGHRSSPII